MHIQGGLLLSGLVIQCHASSWLTDKLFYIVFHVHLFYQCAANDCDHQSHDNIHHSNPGAKMLISSTRLPRSTIGEEIRKEKVTPRGSPALVNPINNGIEEQEQNGVTVPSSAEMIFAQIPLKRPRIRLLRSGGK